MVKKESRKIGLDEKRCTRSKEVESWYSNMGRSESQQPLVRGKRLTIINDDDDDDVQTLYSAQHNTIQH